MKDFSAGVIVLMVRLNLWKILSCLWHKVMDIVMHKRYFVLTAAQGKDGVPGHV